MKGHASVAEQLERLGADAEPLVHALREHDHGGAVLEQLGDVEGQAAMHPLEVCG